MLKLQKKWQLGVWRVMKNTQGVPIEGRAPDNNVCTTTKS